MSDEEIIEVPTFESIRDSHNWKKPLSNDDVNKLVTDAIILCNMTEPFYTVHVKDLNELEKKYPQLVNIIGKAIDLPEFKNVNVIGGAKKRDGLGSVPVFRRFKNKILSDIYGTGQKPNMYFFKHVEKKEVKPEDIKNNLVVPDKNGKMEMDNSGIDDTVKEQVEGAAVQGEEQKKNAKEIKLSDDSIKKITDKLGEPSLGKKFNIVVSEIAKDRNLMSLSEEQLKKKMMNELGFDDSDADTVIKATISKRAELLGKNQLKRDQLTELEVENLQEQSQRDFERKMRDQNLRYILPAMLEKRDRLVVNRLNPELLKCGY